MNSRLTPPSREPHSLWMRRHDVSSLMMVPKLSVFSPLLEVRVLDHTVVRIETEEAGSICWTGTQHVLAMHGVRNPDDRVSRLLDGFDVSWKVVLHLCAVSLQKWLHTS